MQRANAPAQPLLRALDHEVEDEDVRVTLVEYAEEFVSRDADVFAGEDGG